MDTGLVDKEFAALIGKRSIHKKLGIDSGAVRNYRYRLAQGINISTDKKLELLKKSGWTGDEKTFTRQDLVSLLNYWKRTSQTARDQGPEYVIEKWEKTKR